MRHIIIALLLAILATLLCLEWFTPQQSMLLGSVLFLVYLWSSEALPLGVVSLFPLIIFPLLGILDLKTTAPNYSKSIIFLFIGGFLLAIGMQKIGLHTIVAQKLLRLFPKSARGIIYALAITSAVLSAFLSNTTVTIMLVPIALFLTQERALKIRYLLAVAYGASIGGIVTPIGTPPNLILLGFLEDWQFSAPTFLEWMWLTMPVVGAMLLIVPWFLSHAVRDFPIVCEVEEQRKLTPAQKRLMYILLLLVSLLLLNAVTKPLFGWSINEKILLLGFGLLLFMPGIDILSWEDMKEMPYEIIFLFGAGFAIAKAFISTGLAEQIAHYFGTFAHVSLPVLLFMTALFVSFATEITSNTALTSIILPILYKFSTIYALPTPILLFTATVAASYAFMLPIATPPNAIVMSSRVIKIKEMAKIGFLINICGVVAVTIVAITLWRGYFG